MTTTSTTPLRTTSEQAWQETDAATAMNANAVRSSEAFAAHAARLGREAAERRTRLRRAFGEDA